MHKYQCIAEIETDGGVKLSKFRNIVNGMCVCLANVEGPLVSGYFCVATEAHDDDGLPHTLEHLIFRGSEKYPYTNALELIANRCLSEGTNAWTDTDHTCFTVSTAGCEGFLNLLPIYLDHLLYPTLTEENYVTEVHHVNGEGEDAGVVYNEMQAHENTGEDMCYRNMLNFMYPGASGYKSETGGKVKNLRESTSNEKVRAYHRQFYRSENVNLIITGQIEAERVFEALRPIEERIAQDGNRGFFARPWQSEVPHLEESKVLEVEYPCDEEEHGIAMAAFRGPNANNHVAVICLELLMDYLSDTAISPLCRDIVEIEEPLCSSISYSLIENLETCFYVYFSNVAINKLSEVKDKFFSVLNKIVSQEEELDMERIKVIIHKRKLLTLTTMEDNAQEHLANRLIGDFLYGNTLEDLKIRVNEIPILDQLFANSPDFWLDILKKYITDNHHVIVLGKPSSALAKSVAAKEEERLETQRQRLGPEGLKEKGNVLARAKEINEIPTPPEIVQSVPVPPLSSIKFHSVKRACNVTLSKNDFIEFNMSSLPCRFQLDVLKTNFVRMCVLMDTGSLSQDLRMYLPLFLDLLDESAVRRNGELVPYEQVVTELEKDTISISANLGLFYRRFFCGAHAQVFALDLLVEEEKYVKGIQWMHDILFGIEFESKRIKSSLKKLISNISYFKRKGGSVVKCVMNNMLFKPESNHWTTSWSRQAVFLPKLLETVESNPNEVISKLYAIRDCIAEPQKTIVHMATNLDNLRKKCIPEQPWIESFIPNSKIPSIISHPIKRCHELLQLSSVPNGIGDTNIPKNVIVSVGSVETSYLCQCVPINITSRLDPDFAPLLLLLQYLVQFVGPMAKEIRGGGLAYSYDLSLDPDKGLLHLLISNAQQVVQAYEKATSIIRLQVEGGCWDEGLLSSARTSLVSSVIEGLKTVADVVYQSLKAHFTDLPQSYINELLQQIDKVSTADMDSVAAKHLRPLLFSDAVRCVICCPPDKLQTITEGFQEKFSKTLTILPSLEDSFLTNF